MSVRVSVCLSVLIKYEQVDRYSCNLACTLRFGRSLMVISNTIMAAVRNSDLEATLVSFNTRS